MIYNLRSKMTYSVVDDFGSLPREAGLHRIVYRSISLLREDSETLIFDLIRLLEQSITYNRQHGITGVLAYRNSTFLQVIEGPRDAIVALFERIRRDYRHNDIRLIVDEHCDERSFPDWSMAYLGYEHDLSVQFERTTGSMTAAAAEEMLGSLASLLV